VYTCWHEALLNLGVCLGMTALNRDTQVYRHTKRRIRLSIGTRITVNGVMAVILRYFIEFGTSGWRQTHTVQWVVRLSFDRRRRYQSIRECGHSWPPRSRACSSTRSRKASRECVRASTRFWSNPPRTTTSISGNLATRWRSAVTWTRKDTGLAHRLARTYGRLSTGL